MQTSLSPIVCRTFLGCQSEKAVDELNLTKKIISCHPSSLPLPDHVDCFVALNRSPSCLEFSEALFGVHSTFDGSMILFENVVQVLHRSVSTAGAQRPFLFSVRDRRAVNRLCSAKTSAGRNLHDFWCRSGCFLRLFQRTLFGVRALCEADLPCCHFEAFGSVTSAPSLLSSGNYCAMGCSS